MTEQACTIRRVAGRSSNSGVLPLLTLALVLHAGGAHAQQRLTDERAGAVSLIVRTAKTDGSAGSSFDRDTLVERVIDVRDDGLELEYDTPEVTAKNRASQWQFPVRVLKAADEALKLLNGRELESRVDDWLQRAKLPRSACGHWYFTWNAFQIECDPQSVLRTVAAFDLRPRGLGDGATYMDPDAAEPMTLKATMRGPGGATSVGGAAVAPEHVRQAEAQADVVAAEINRRSLTLEDALRARSAEKVSGTVEVTFETDPAGLVRERIRLIRLDITGPDGTTATRAVAETVERRPAPKR